MGRAFINRREVIDAIKPRMTTNRARYTTNRSINDVGEDVLGVKGDFEYNLVASEDGYGVSPMKDLKSVQEQAAKENYYSREREVQVIKPILTEDKVAPKKVAQISTYIPTATPQWAKIMFVAGVPAGLMYAAHKDCGFLGYIGFGLIGGFIGSLPYNYLKGKK